MTNQKLIFNNESYHQKGLMQLGEYLGQHNLNEGYLLIFDFRRVNGEAGTMEETTISIGDKEKRIVEVYC